MAKARKTRDTFKVGDRIQVINTGSKHYDRKASIVKVGNRRLTVSFDRDDPRPGMYVDFDDARKLGIVRTQDTSTPAVDMHNSHATGLTDTTSERDDDLGELTRLLEHLAFTSATLISSRFDDPERMESLMLSFSQQVRLTTRTMASSRNNNSRP